MHLVSHVVDETLPASFEATMRITLGGGTLELTNHADTALVASRSVIKTHFPVYEIIVSALSLH